MKQIKFSHDYWKLPSKIRLSGKGVAILLQVIKIHFNELSTWFKNYDTYYFDNHYELPNTDLILLLLRTKDTPELFTTIRRYTQNKWKYYKELEGQSFEVILK